MREIPAAGSSGPLEICTICHLLWFDPGELESLAVSRSGSPAPGLSAGARQSLALAEVEVMREAADAADFVRMPQTFAEMCLVALRIPIKYTERPLRRPALLTRFMLLAVAGVGGAALFDLDRWVSELALIPSQPWRHGGVTLFTSFVLHADVFHLLGNLYFWWLFGEEIEDSVGRRRYLLLIASAALLGGLLHIAFDPRPDVPVIGASGGISGLIAYYALRFPRARFGIPIGLTWVRFGSRTYVSLWIGAQLVGAMQQVIGATSVSAFAHLGGATAGLFWWLASQEKGAT